MFGYQIVADTQQGVLDNSRGNLVEQSGLNLTTGKLNNRAGVIQSGSDMLLDTHGRTLINQQSGESGDVMVSADNLQLNSGALSNIDGIIAADHRLTLETAGVENQRGLLQAGSDLTLDTQGHTLINTTVVTSTASLRLTISCCAAAGDVTINTAGQTLTNQQGLIAGSGNTRIDGGSLDNQQGQIQGGKDLTLKLGQNLLQNQNGKLFSAGTTTLMVGQLINHSSQLQSIGPGTLVLTQLLDNDNTDGLIKSDQGLDITAPQLINRDTQQSGKGIEADTLSVQANLLDNSQGALRANARLAQTPSGRRWII